MKRVYFLIIATLITSITFAQKVADTTNGQLHDDLLDHLVGKWNITSVAHGFSSTAVLGAEWVLNHQFLHYHLKSNEAIPWIHMQMEIDCFISYNHSSKHYVVLGMSVFGVDDFEGFCYGYRNGNELKLIQKGNNKTDPTNIQRYTWEPISKSWAIQSRRVIAGKEGDVFLDMKLVAAK
ncbi:MAG: hypothetical protein ABI863_00325 [Ginsengibacter sp.]